MDGRPSADPLVGHRKKSAIERELLHLTSSSRKVQEGSCQCEKHCLRWTLRSALFPACDHVDKPSKYFANDDLNFKGIDAPTPSSQIPKVEKWNNLAINVFVWDKGVTIYRLSKQPQEIPRISMLLIEKAGKFHYTWIKNLSRLLYDQS